MACPRSGCSLANIVKKIIPGISSNVGLNGLGISRRYRGSRGGIAIQRIIKTRITNRTCITTQVKSVVPNVNNIISINTTHVVSNCHPIPAAIATVQRPIPTVVSKYTHPSPSESVVDTRQYTNLVTLKREKSQILDKVNIGYFNARSVRNKASELSEFVVDKRLDMCAITETWINDVVKDKVICGDLTPPGYKLEHTARSLGKGGGVAVLCKSELQAKKQKVSKYLAFESLELMLKCHGGDIRLCVIYRPPLGSKYSKPLSEFLREFHHYMDSHATSSGKLVVLGDFNLHFEMNNVDTSRFKDLLFSLNLDQHVNGPTHQHGHTLDLVITRAGDSPPQNVKVLPSVFSDHSPLTFLLQIRRPPVQSKMLSYRKIRNVDIEAFKADIIDCPLILTPENDIDKLVDQYNGSLSSILDNHAPIITKKVHIRPNTPWFNEDISMAKRMRRKAERQWLSTKLTVHLELFRQAHRHVTKLCKMAKAVYYQAEIIDNASNPKALFKITDALMHKKAEAKLPCHTDSEILANEFVTFFSEKIKTITTSFPSDAVLDSVDAPKMNEGLAQFPSFKPATEDDIRKIILSGNSKSCHQDPIPTTLLKECLPCLLPALTMIVNTSLSSCTVPLALKAATVIPLIKKPDLDPEQKKNYRPVSNLSYLSKLIEKVVVAQLDVHMSENKLYETYQSAYRKNHSTETALLKISDDLLGAMDKSKCAMLILLDQSAAFDTVDQGILLQRLKVSYGITGSALAWLKSYFEGRTQAVSISGMLSKPKELDTGFPQGSVLGPFKYPSYTSPLFGIARKYNISMHMYADDTQVYLCFDPKDSTSAVHNMQECIGEIQQWMFDNHLKLNESKTEFLVIGNPHMLKSVSGLSSIKIGDALVEAAGSAKNIGAVLDSSLTLVEHVSRTARSCYMHLHQISQIRPCLTDETAATLVRSLIFSKLDYANSLLFGLPDQLVNKLQMVQNNAARLVMGKRKSDHVTPLLKSLHWLPIKFRIEYKINLITYKALHGQAPEYISSLLQEYKPTRPLRSSSMGLLQEKRARLKRSGDRAFSICAPRLWNNLPCHVRFCDTTESFKKALKTYLFRKAFN